MRFDQIYWSPQWKNSFFVQCKFEMPQRDFENILKALLKRGQNEPDFFMDHELTMDGLIYQNKVSTDMLIFTVEWCAKWCVGCIQNWQQWQQNNINWHRSNDFTVNFKRILLTIQNICCKKTEPQKHFSQETIEFWGSRRELMNLN